MLYDRAEKIRADTTRAYRVVIFGGEREIGAGYKNDAWHLWINKYTGALEWKEIDHITNLANSDSIPSARAWASGVIDDGGRTVIYGGETSGGAVTDSVVYGLDIPFAFPGYDGINKTWTKLKGPGFPMSGQTMVTTPYLVFSNRPETVAPGDSSS